MSHVATRCNVGMTVVPSISYGSTFYTGIAMVILPYFGPMGKVKFSLSVST